MFYLYVILSIFIGLLLAMKMYFKLNAVIYLGKEQLDGKTVLVTGANSGIGFLCAKDFAKRGAKVLLICRDMITGEDAKKKIIIETGNKNIKLKHIDFASLRNVRKCAEEILEEEKFIHILLNNAGYNADVIKSSEDNLDLTMQINYFGQFLFTNLLLGKIKKSSPGRIVNVSSRAHSFSDLDLDHLKVLNTKSTLTAYCLSKLALNYFSNELARLLKNSGVTVNALHPGFFPSGISRHQSFFFKTVINFIATFFANTPKEGAQTSIYCCVSSDVENITGKYFENCKIATPSKASQDMEIAIKLWKLTEDIVDLKPEEKHY